MIPKTYEGLQSDVSFFVPFYVFWVKLILHYDQNIVSVTVTFEVMLPFTQSPFQGCQGLL